jgi:asparagine synthase (glutamine-hydrolysing)
MQQHAYIDRLVDLIDTDGNVLLNMSYDEAAEAVASGDADAVGRIQGQFAIIQKRGNIVRMARTIGRPMRYFLAKRAEGPCLIVAERIDEIRDTLEKEGLADQFHPSYTRMVPAHHIIELALIGCPDPNPNIQRFFTPLRNQFSTDLEEIGKAYISALKEQCRLWLDTIDPYEPIGVLFSGGIDSGSVLLILYKLLLERGESPSRLKAFTLSVAEGSIDSQQAYEFLDHVDLTMLLEVIQVDPADVQYRDAIKTVEDYKPLDVQSATMALALCKAIRAQFPDWKYLVDGDGGDENMKDYPIEDNPELTIRSVLNNLMLYQEGWGVDTIKHSLVYSGGQSRGHVRSYAPGKTLGFTGFSPYALPDVINVAEGIPFVELTDWNHEKLYALKGKIVKLGVEAITGLSMPVFDKRRFQHGAVQGQTSFEALFPKGESDYRDCFNELYAPQHG